MATTDPKTQRTHDTLSRVLLVSLAAPAKGVAHLPALAQVRSRLPVPSVCARATASHTLLAVSSQELAAEGKAVAVDHPNVAERVLFAVLQACPLDVAPSPFQYLLGCVCRNCRGPSQPRCCPPGDGVRLTQCLPFLSAGATAAPQTRAAAWAHATARSAPWSAKR